MAYTLQRAELFHVHVTGISPQLLRSNSLEEVMYTTAHTGTVVNLHQDWYYSSLTKLLKSASLCIKHVDDYRTAGLSLRPQHLLPVAMFSSSENLDLNPQRVF